MLSAAIASPSDVLTARVNSMPPYRTSGDGVRVTLCFGGSIIAPNVPDLGCIREIADALRELRSRRHEVLAVVGGGATSRTYIEAARKLKASDVSCDTIGIDATRLNARLLIAALGELAEPSPVLTFEAAIRAMLRGKIPVMGGTVPGHTTDAVAAMLANSSRSEMLMFFTDVDGVYTADPKLDPSAKKLEAMTACELVKLVTGVKMEPGVKVIVDPVGARIIERARIRTLVLGRHEIKRMPEILEGDKHSGTAILPGG
ncbi:MAG: UMP kinase [Candidatus Hodarchaeaceae archaeon]|nr:UMP kinase [Candidatus Hodarchaeaceae archaeon]